ncbi:hypothetical protein DQP55_20805 [Mycolicibacterium sp. GF69]|nr:hypothetical protein DQP55_20805 [Mycolicibacterium sp. GF69]
MSDRKFDEPGYFFDTEAGSNIALPAPTLAPRDEIVNQACTVSTNSAGDPRIVYLQTIKTPSQGLTPESHRTELVSFDPSKESGPVTIKPFPIVTDDNDWSLLPATSAIVAHRDSHGSTQSLFFDPDTLELKTKAESLPDNPLIGLNHEGYAKFSLNIPRAGYGYTSRDIHFFNGMDGAEIGAFRNVGLFITTNHGFFLEHDRDAKVTNPDDLQSGVFYFDMRTKDITGPVAPYLDTDGKFWSDPTNAAQYVYGEQILLMGGDSDAGEYITVFDMGSKQEKFKLDSQQIEGLKIENAYLADNFVYLQNESDNPVIDYRTKEAVSSGWNLRPVYALDDGWTWVVPGHAADSHSPHANGLCVNNYGTSCIRGAATSQDGEYLARAENGPYDGPWF